MISRPKFSLNTDLACEAWRFKQFFKQSGEALLDEEAAKVVSRPVFTVVYQYSNMTPRLSEVTSIFGVDFFFSVFKSHLRIEREKKVLKEKITILTREPLRHVRILTYRTRPINAF